MTSQGDDSTPVPGIAPAGDDDGDPNPGTRQVRGNSNTSTTAPDTSSSQHSEDHRIVLIGFAVALIGALIGGVFSYLGAYQQARTQIESQSSQLFEDQKKEQREKRAEVYEEFLKAADTFAVETNKIITDCKDGKCSPNWGDWQTARYDYQGAVNHVWVFGSDAAVKQLVAVSGTLPESVWAPNSDELNLRFKSTGFTTAYNGFQSLMCRELPAQPRNSC
ncbi:hypothetical protein OG828_07685 [Streptomyces sp. NBC_00457]|uniref:hypothetical protein n=1 Tax=Streptomyces sp. NBC_00457 TaxID=2975748 RepID=UPI002E238641